MKKIILILVFIIVIGFIIKYIISFPIVIDSSSIDTKQEDHSIGDTVGLLKSLDLSDGEWKAYIIFNKEDNDSKDRLLPKKVYKTNDIELLKQMQKNWVFAYTGADMATVQSKILFFKNNKLVFKSGIVLEKDIEGLQTAQCGWLESSEKNLLYRYCKRFRSIKAPFVILK